MKTLLRLFRDRAGAAAVELAMSLPVVLILAYASFEMGNYFWTEHVVQKAARDAARYAARIPMVSYPSCAPTAAAEQQIRRVARTGLPDGTTSNRIHTWTADNMTTVTLTCDTSGTYTGVFTNFPNGVPVVTVTSTVPYASLWGTLGFGSIGLNIYGRSQSPVFGA
jgi:Flp pilus assembly protein TadG